MKTPLLLGAGIGCLLASTSPAWAQPADAPSPQDVQEAANAFAEGQRAQLRGDNARAAEMFEIANSTAPSSAALRSAIRNHKAAGHAAQAATGALEALALYASDRTTTRLANEILVDLAPGLARVLLECVPECTATMDGRLVGRAAFTRREMFVDPGNHSVRAEWSGHGNVDQAFTGVAGQPQAVRLERPPAPVEPPPPEVTEPVEPHQVEPPPPPPYHPRAPAPRSGLSPVVFWVGTGLTLVATGVTIWSGMDTLSARDDYVDDPTREGYDDGVDLELRTNALIVTSAVLGAATIAVGLFLTDWGPSEFQPVVSLGPDGGLLGLRGPL